MRHVRVNLKSAQGRRAIGRVLLCLGLLTFVATGPAEAQFLEHDVVVVHEFAGEAANDQFGWVTDPLRDVDGDNVPEIIISANGNDEGGMNAGKVYVYSGKSGALLFSFVGMTGDNAGVDVGDAGDVNNDGVIDVIVGADLSGAGRAYLISGKDGTLIRVLAGDRPQDRFGASVSGLDDVDHDGFADVLVAAHGNDAAGSNAGRVYLISGQTGLPIYTVDGESDGDRLGSAINSLDDLDGDGTRDFVVGARHAGPNAGGRAYVCSGATGTWLYPPLLPDGSGVDFGLYFVGSAGDASGDGLSDVYVSDFSAPGGGKAYVFDGASGTQLHQIGAAQNGEGFGIGRSAAGDLDRDGREDLVLAAWTSSDGAARAGKAQIFSGRDASILRTVTSTTAGEGFGFDAHGIGDLNEDGRPEMVISAAYNGANGFHAGRVYVIAGKPAFRRGDLNCDGAFDGADIDPFFLALGDQATYESMFPDCDIENADMNGDESVDGADIDAFFACLGGSCR